MILPLLFLGLFSYAQAQACVPETQPIGSLGQADPGIDGTMIQTGSPYSMIDIDGAAQMPAGIITGLEYRVFRLDRVSFQVWRQLDILQGRFQLIATVELNPTEVEEVMEIRDLNITVESKDRWGFSYNGNGLDVPIKYSVALNEPNGEPYMALECTNGCAAGRRERDEVVFPTQKVQKQFRMHAMMSVVVSTCPPPTVAPPECVPPSRQVPAESILRSEVFSNYDPNVRPENLGKILLIKLSTRPIQVVSFTDVENGEVLKVMFYADQEWRDDLLAWCPEDHGNIRNLKIKTSEIWTPDFSPHTAQIDSDIGGRAILNSDGTIHHKNLKIWDFPCQMIAETEETKDFNCSSKFESWVYTGTELNYILSEGGLDLSQFQKHLNIEVISTTKVKEDIIYPCCPGIPYPTIYLHVVIRVSKQGEEPPQA